MIDSTIYNAFNLKNEGVPLKGGQNNSYRFGDIIIKKNDGDNVNYEVTAKILNEIESPHYRVAKPIPSQNGRYIERGYIATHFEQGYHNSERIEETISLSKIFHKDLEKFDISLYKKSNTQWAIAMDILFRNREIPIYADENNLDICNEMLSILPPTHDPLQIIHADIGGNVLFHDTLPPCIIDFSPNIAPAKMAEAIIISDAVAWGNRNLDIIKYLVPHEKYEPYLLYAVMFRLLSALVKKSGTQEEFKCEYNAYKKIWDYVIKNKG